MGRKRNRRHRVGKQRNPRLIQPGAPPGFDQEMLEGFRQVLAKAVQA